MSNVKTQPIPTGYAHKATSENFGCTDKVSIYYDGYDYLVVVNDSIEEQSFCFSKTQLELIIHAANDVLQDQRR